MQAVVSKGEGGGRACLLAVVLLGQRYGRKKALSTFLFFPLDPSPSSSSDSDERSCPRWSGGREHPSQWASKQAAALGNSPFMRGHIKMCRTWRMLSQYFMVSPSEVKRAVRSTLVYIGIFKTRMGKVQSIILGWRRQSMRNLGAERPALA